VPSVDFNADLGESYGPWRRGADDELMTVISSASVDAG
jgi:5-oxoprolinase (ATP-hydrolysing) subunit A